MLRTGRGAQDAREASSVIREPRSHGGDDPTGSSADEPISFPRASSITLRYGDVQKPLLKEAAEPSGQIDTTGQGFEPTLEAPCGGGRRNVHVVEDDVKRGAVHRGVTVMVFEPSGVAIQKAVEDARRVAGIAWFRGTGPALCLRQWRVERK